MATMTTWLTGSADGSQVLSVGAVGQVINNLRTLRILRSLKMISRFQKVRLIILSVTKALSAMLLIAMLLGISMYILAVIGVMYFKEKYRKFIEQQLLSVVDPLRIDTSTITKDTFTANILLCQTFREHEKFKSEDDAGYCGLLYPNSFDGLLNTIWTLFRLFTLDGWLSVYKDLSNVLGTVA